MKNKKNILKLAVVVVGFIGLCAFTAAAWKTYSNKYISFKYPDTYKITDEEQTEDGYDLCCELKGDDLSMVQISIMDFDEELDGETSSLALSLGALAMKSNLESSEYYSNVSTSEVKAVKKGKNDGYGFTFSATMLGFPIKGEGFMAFSGKKGRLLTLVMQAENMTYLGQLNEIANGMVVK